MKINTDSIRRIVVKVGTSTLTHEGGAMNLRKIEKLVRCLADIHNTGKQVILVSSGAVGCGLSKLHFDRSTLTLQQKQAAASVGQCDLIGMYSKEFAQYGHVVAQLLLTKDVVDNETRYNHAKNTLETLLEAGVIPIVNENDTVSGEQIRFGSNDTLAAVVALLSHADLLVNMSDIDGLYTADPRKDPSAVRMDCVEEITPEIQAAAGGAGSSRGTGGMVAKLESAKTVTEAGIPMIICSGDDPAMLYAILDGTFIGTYFKAKKD